jgi:hypothetical protein
MKSKKYNDEFFLLYPIFIDKLMKYFYKKPINIFFSILKA